MGPEDLVQVLSRLPAVRDPRVLAGVGEDACVYRLGDDLALVQTVDFITPVVDDPRSFGMVAAANALSDIYAMGARPLFALNLVSYPVRTLPLHHLEAILLGGAEKAAEAGVSILGGHSVDDPTPKYGLAVTGVVDPSRLVRKSGARPGDRLVLSKPLGIGVLTTAVDHGLAGAEVGAQVLPVMAELNRAAAEAMQAVGARACTDVTGFGLLGHLRELAQQSGVAVRVRLSQVPVLDGAREMVREGAVSLGTQNNYRHLRDRVTWGAGASLEDRLILCDAQTSGGLLIAASPDATDPLLAALAAAGCRAAAIGEATEGLAGHIAVEA